jgi:hypothetical protein
VQGEQHEQHEEDQDAPFTQVDYSSRKMSMWVECTLRDGLSAH